LLSGKGTGLFQAYSEAIIIGTGTNPKATDFGVQAGEDYIADVPEPSRSVGAMGIAAMGVLGLCFGYARKRRPVIC
jgi:hypothetical protein